MKEIDFGILKMCICWKESEVKWSIRYGVKNLKYRLNDVGLLVRIYFEMVLSIGWYYWTLWEVVLLKKGGFFFIIIK